MNWTLQISAILGLLLCVTWVECQTCDPVKVAKCTSPFDQASQKGAGGFMDYYDKAKVETICSAFATTKMCAGQALMGCDKEMLMGWSMIKGTFTYFCSDEGKEGYLKHAECFKKQPVVDGVSRCNTTFERNVKAKMARKDSYPTPDALHKEICGLATRYLQCNYDIISRRCDKDAGDWVKTATASSLHPIASMMGCDLGVEGLMVEGEAEEEGEGEAKEGKGVEGTAVGRESELNGASTVTTGGLVLTTAAILFHFLDL